MLNKPDANASINQGKNLGRKLLFNPKKDMYSLISESLEFKKNCVNDTSIDGPEM